VVRAGAKAPRLLVLHRPREATASRRGAPDGGK
jgi:hypothetical protein